MTGTIRPARKGDAAALAALVDIAGEGMPSHVWSTMKAPGQSLLEFGRSRALREEGAFSYRNAHVIEMENDVAAALVDYRLDDPYDAGDLGAVSEIVRPLILLESKAPGSWYVNVLAAFPELRNRGFGGQLLALSQERARASGAHRMSIIVASENAGAMRLYGRFGFGELARERAVSFPGCAHGGEWVLMLKDVN